MAEVLVEFADDIEAPDGTRYRARACGGEMTGGMWQGWIEFTPPEGEPVLRSSRETTQPNRQDTVYWATGLTSVFLEGSLHRALTPRTAGSSEEFVPSAYDGPAPSVLNPFSVYRKGEVLLRRQLAALSSWHLVNIVRAHGLSRQSNAELARLNAAEMIELIVAAVRVEEEASSRT